MSCGRLDLALDRWTAGPMDRWAPGCCSKSRISISSCCSSKPKATGEGGVGGWGLGAGGLGGGGFGEGPRSWSLWAWAWSFLSVLCSLKRRQGRSRSHLLSMCGLWLDANGMALRKGYPEPVDVRFLPHRQYWPVWNSPQLRLNRKVSPWLPFSLGLNDRPVPAQPGWLTSAAPPTTLPNHAWFGR